VGRKTLGGLATTLLVATLLVLVGSSPAGAAFVTDNFNRANGTDLGAGWTEAGTDLAIEGNQLTNAANNTSFAQAVGGTGDTAQARVIAASAGNANNYAAVAVRVTDATDMIMVRVQDNDADGTFDHIIGTEGNGTGAVIFNSELATEFADGVLIVRSDGTNVTAGIDTTGDGVPEQIRNGQTSTEAAGTGVGVGVANKAHLDDFASSDTGVDTSVDLQADISPSTFGQSVIFTATVTATDGSTPTGGVVFRVDGAFNPPVGLNDGQAVFERDDLSVGDHTITAEYEPDTFDHHASAAEPLGHTVGQASTTLSLVSDREPAEVGETITFTATVGATNTTTAPDGEIEFTVDTDAPVGVALVDGVATLSRSDLTLGTHTITASYAGNTKFAAATDKSVTQHVNRVTTTTTLTSDPNPSDFGETVTFTASVTGTGGAPVTSGTVTFADSGFELAQIIGDGDDGTEDGNYTLTISNLNPGSHSISATYNPTEDFSSSVGTVTHVVDKAAASVTVTASPTPSVAGQSVTITAEVTSGAGTPTGTVTFTEGVDVLAEDVPIADGKATFTTSTLAVGDHTIGAAYGGSTLFEEASGEGSHNVSQADTTTTIESSDEPAGAGQQVTFTVTVAAEAPGSGTPTGSVELSINGGSPTTISLTNGQGTLTVPFDTIGTYPIAAVYDGDASFTGSSGSFTQTVIDAFTTTTVTSSEDDNVSTYGQPVTFTVTVTSNGASPAEGSVELFDGDTSLGSAVVANAPVNFEVAGLAVGSHGLTATYSGSTSTSPSSSGALTHSVVQADSTVTVADAGGFSIDVTVARPAAGASAAAVAGPAIKAPSGEITVTENGTEVGKGTLTDAGTAQVSMQGLTAGAHALTVTYAGDTNNKSATATFEKTVSAETAAGSGAGAGAGDVARTGANSGPLVLGGIVLVTAGGAAVAVATELRRRRRRPVPSRLAPEP
jgi:hypothetical protein